MPGRRNPVGLSTIIEHIDDAVQRRRSSSASEGVPTADQRKRIEIPYVDLRIQFVGASGLPRMSVVRSAHPYFVAKLDDKISFVSNVKTNTFNPVWNELWNVKNVPADAILHIEVMDKDDGAPTDGYIGKFQTAATSGVKEEEIHKPSLRRRRGTFWLKIDTSPSSSNAPTHPYLFDGPIRYSRHSSLTIGRFTNINPAHLYSTWKIYLKGIPLFFPSSLQQHWNYSYKAAQSIFQGPASPAVRSGIQAGHRMMYARSATNGFGVIDSTCALYSILQDSVPASTSATQSLSNGVRAPKAKSPALHRIKPAIYTYVLMLDDSLRFSETDRSFFTDFASKHALHSNCAESVRYAGEFHPRPVGGWENYDDVEDRDLHMDGEGGVKWELVVDNSSGTYTPDPALLPNIKSLLEYNFPEIRICTLAHEDPEKKRSKEACRAYALKHRGGGDTEIKTSDTGGAGVDMETSLPLPQTRKPLSRLQLAHPSPLIQHSVELG